MRNAMKLLESEALSEPPSRFRNSLTKETATTSLATLTRLPSLRECESSFRCCPTSQKVTFVRAESALTQA